MKTLQLAFETGRMDLAAATLVYTAVQTINSGGNPGEDQEPYCTQKIKTEIREPKTGYAAP
jgi:hypothetical protein